MKRLDFSPALSWSQQQRVMFLWKHPTVCAHVCGCKMNGELIMIHDITLSHQLDTSAAIYGCRHFPDTSLSHTVSLPSPVLLAQRCYHSDAKEKEDNFWEINNVHIIKNFLYRGSFIWSLLQPLLHTQITQTHLVCHILDVLIAPGIIRSHKMKRKHINGLPPGQTCTTHCVFRDTH